MLFKKIHHKLDAMLHSIAIITTKTNAYDTARQQYEKEIERLIEQNRELMNRFMARDFEQLQLYQVANEKLELKETPPEEDELNAGEVLDLET
jgi:hypothetical protein